MQTLMRSFVALLALTLVACSGEQTATNGNQGPGPTGDEIQRSDNTDLIPTLASNSALPGMPALADLSKLPSLEGFHIQDGCDYLDELPSQNALKLLEKAMFYPRGSTAGDMAYAIYRFNLGEISGPQTLSLEYDAAWGFNEDPPNSWVGLSNWETMSWDWFPAYVPEYIDLGVLNDYSNPGTADCYIIVAYLEWPTICLKGLRLDDSVTGPPYVGKVTHDSARVDVEVQFFPYYIGTEPLVFNWEFGSAFEPTTSSDCEPVAIPKTAGTFDCFVTVSNAYGQRTLPFTVEVIANQEPWIHAYINDYYASMFDDYEGNCISCASNASGNLYFLDHLSLRHEAEDDTCWCLPNLDQYGRDLASQNEKMATGHMLRPINPISVSCYWADSYQSQFLGGIEYPSGGGAEKSFAGMFYNESGTPVWYNSFDPDTLAGEVYGITDSEYITHLVGRSMGSTNNNGTVLVTIGSYGDILETLGWYGESGCQPRSIAMDHDENIYVAGNLFKPSGDCTYVVKVDSAGHLIAQTQLIGDGDPSIIVSDVGTHVYLTGNQNPDTITALDSDLNQSWVYSYQGDFPLSFISIIPSVPGGLHALATYIEQDLGEEVARYLLVTIDRDGTVIRCKRWVDDCEDEELVDIAPAPGGMVYVVGNSMNDHGGWEMLSSSVNCIEGEILADNNLELDVSHPEVSAVNGFVGCGGGSGYNNNVYSEYRKILVMRVFP